MWEHVTRNTAVRSLAEGGQQTFRVPSTLNYKGLFNSYLLILLLGWRACIPSNLVLSLP